VGEVFISYARPTQALAEQVERALIAAGHVAWRDSALPAHRAYSDVIEERLLEASAVIVLWSKDAVRSEWVRSEANKGRELGKLVQASLDRTPPPMPFDQLHCVDLEGGPSNSEGWRKVLESVADLAGGAAATPLLASNHALPPARRSHDRLLAVLPFENLSGDPEFAYFSDGVADEILHAIIKTTGLRVIARSSSFQLRGEAKAPANVAHQLKATHMLDGTVRRGGGRVRVTAELVECETQTLLWGDRFDSELTDILALQDEIAEAVATALRTTFAARETRAIDPVAYDLYLRARELDSSKLGYDIPVLEEVTSIDPDFLPAWEGLALSYATKGRWNADASVAADWRAKMDRAVEQALAIDPRSSGARIAQSMMMPTCGAFLETERLVAEALNYSPIEAFALVAASSTAAAVGRNGVAFAYGRKAYEADPLHLLTVGWYGALLATTGRTHEAAAHFDAAIERWPDDGFIRITALGKDLETLDWARFARHARHPGNLGIYGPWRDLLVQAESDLRNWNPEIAARSLAQERAILSATGTIRISPLGHMVRLGLRDEVFQMIDEASFDHLFTPNGRLLAGEVTLALLFEPAARSMQEDPRFVRLCARLGFCSYWLETGRWPDCVAETAPFYDFRSLAEAEARRLPPPG